MRHYELMVILDPDIEERTVAPALDQFLNVVKTDGGSVELALAWRRGGDNPVVDAVVTVLSSAFGQAFAPAAVERERI